MARSLQVLHRWCPFPCVPLCLTEVNFFCLVHLATCVGKESFGPQVFVCVCVFFKTCACVNFLFVCRPNNPDPAPAQGEPRHK